MKSNKSIRSKFAICETGSFVLLIKWKLKKLEIFAIDANSTISKIIESEVKDTILTISPVQTFNKAFDITGKEDGFCVVYETYKWEMYQINEAMLKQKNYSNSIALQYQISLNSSQISGTPESGTMAYGIQGKEMKMIVGFSNGILAIIDLKQNKYTKKEGIYTASKIVDLKKLGTNFDDLSNLTQIFVNKSGSATKPRELVVSFQKAWKGIHSELEVVDYGLCIYELDFNTNEIIPGRMTVHNLPGQVNQLFFEDRNAVFFSDSQVYEYSFEANVLKVIGVENQLSGVTIYQLKRGFYIGGT